MPSFTWAIEMEFSGVGAGWTSVKADVLRAAPVSWGYGINGAGPLDRIAGTGQLTFVLDNSTANSAATLGYYSPDHASVRSGFAIGIRCRLTATYSGTTYYKFIGTLESITPEAGARGARVVYCTVLDWMDEAAKQKTANIATQVDKRPDEIIGAIVANMTRQPISTSYAAGQLEYPYALDTAEDESSAAMTELAKAVYSDVGYLYVKGDTSAGGVLRFEDRRVRQAATTVLTTLTVQHGLSIGHSRAGVYNRVKVSINPRRVDAAATTVLYQYDAAQLLTIGPSETVTIIGQYRDPDQRAQRVGGVDLVTPVAYTDYAFGTGVGDTGMTASLSVSATSGGNSVILELTNSGTVSGFVTLLQVRGRGLYAYDPVTLQTTDSTSRTTYGEFVLSIDLPHEPRQHVAQSVADTMLARHKDARAHETRVTIVGNYSDALMTAALAREPGDLVAVTESVTGLSADQYFINGVSYQIDGGNILTASWVLAPDYDAATVFILDTSALDGAHVLGW